MKKKKLITRLLAIKSDQYNSEFHSDYKKQKRNSPLIQFHNELPKIKTSLNKNLPANFHTSLNLYKTSRNDINNIQTLQNNAPLLVTERICYPKIFQNKIYIKDNNSSFRTKIQKKNNKALSMKYIDLFRESKEFDYIFLNKVVHEYDIVFKNEILEKLPDRNKKQEFLNDLKEYKDKYDTIMENFLLKTLNKNEEPALFIEKIPDDIIDNYAESIYKQYLNKNDNKNKSKELIKAPINNEDEKNNNINKKNNELIIHNVFFEFAIKNTMNKIEFRNQYNKEISINYIYKLINYEIKQLKLAILKFKRFSEKNFLTIDSKNNDNQHSSSIKEYNSNFTNVSSLTDRFIIDKKILKNKLKNKSLNIRHLSDIRYNKEFNDITSNIETGNMYITEVNKEYPFLAKKSVEQIKAINIGNKTNTNINLLNEQNNDNFINNYNNNYNHYYYYTNNNNIKTIPNKFTIESYSGKNQKTKDYITVNNKVNYIFPHISKDFKYMQNNIVVNENNDYNLLRLNKGK